MKRWRDENEMMRDDPIPYDTFNAKAWMRRALAAETELEQMRASFRCWDCGDPYTPLVCRNCGAKRSRPGGEA
jgi:hypothetical protein